MTCNNFGIIVTSHIVKLYYFSSICVQSSRLRISYYDNNCIKTIKYLSNHVSKKVLPSSKKKILH